MSNNKFGLLGSGPIVNNGNLVVRKTNSTVFTQNISGTGALYMTDWGVLELRGTNTYTGGTTVTWGVLKLGHANALPTVGSITLVGTTNITGGGGFDGTGRGGRLDLNGFAQTIDELNSIGIGGPANTLTPGSPTDAYIQSNATLISDIATLTINRTGPEGFNSGIHNGAEGNQNPVGQIALVKQSNGVATMNYTSTGTISTNYSGVTSINGGTLIVRGIHSPAGVGLGTYNVATGAALAGDGGISAQVNVASGGIVAPGVTDDSQFGTFNIASLSLNSSNLNFQLTGSETDLLDVNLPNALLLSGTSNVNLTVVDHVNAGTFDLLNYSGALIPDLLTKIQLGSVTNGSTFNFFLAADNQNSKLQLIVTQPIVSAAWNVDGSGTWGIGSFWTTNPTTPNAFGSTANFTGINAPQTVTMDGPFQIGTANFSTTAGFTIAGSSITTLTLGGTSSLDLVGINATQGSHVISAPLAANNNTVFNVSAGATLTLGGGYGFNANGAQSGHHVTKTGAGMLVVDNIRNTFGNNGSALLSVQQGTLQVAHHSTANAAEGTSKVNSLTIANGAKLDLTNNSMVLDYTAALGGDGSAILTQLRGWINNADGRLYSSDADSTHGIGYKDNSNITGAGNKGVSNFGGVVVDGSSVLIKFTYLGDTNVDGQVDLSDLYNLATNYDPKHTKGGSAVWQKGDSNYDGWVDLKDLTALAVNWQAGVGSPLGGGLGSSLSAALASFGLPQVAVPEPATVGLMGLGLTGLMARRRRRN
jgi:autotransporter-associated beta strand protein